MRGRLHPRLLRALLQSPERSCIEAVEELRTLGGSDSVQSFWQAWIDVSGSSARDVARQLREQQLMMPGRKLSDSEPESCELEESSTEHSLSALRPRTAVGPVGSILRDSEKQPVSGSCAGLRLPRLRSAQGSSL